MSTVHCGSQCVTHQQSQQYPGAPGAPPPLVAISGGTLPFTGLGLPLLVLVALLLVAAGSLARRLA